jgi:hypothetical protein
MADTNMLWDNINPSPEMIEGMAAKRIEAGTLPADYWHQIKGTERGAILSKMWAVTDQFAEEQMAADIVYPRFQELVQTAQAAPDNPQYLMLAKVAEATLDPAVKTRMVWMTMQQKSLSELNGSNAPENAQHLGAALKAYILENGNDSLAMNAAHQSIVNGLKGFLTMDKKDAEEAHVELFRFFNCTQPDSLNNLDEVAKAHLIMEAVGKTNILSFMADKMGEMQRVGGKSERYRAMESDFFVAILNSGDAIAVDAENIRRATDTKIADLAAVLQGKEASLAEVTSEADASKVKLADIEAQIQKARDAEEDAAELEASAEEERKRVEELAAKLAVAELAVSDAKTGYEKAVADADQEPVSFGKCQDLVMAAHGVIIAAKQAGMSEEKQNELSENLAAHLMAVPEGWSLDRIAAYRSTMKDAVNAMSPDPRTHKGLKDTLAGFENSVLSHEGGTLNPKRLLTPEEDRKKKASVDLDEARSAVRGKGFFGMMFHNLGMIYQGLKGVVNNHLEVHRLNGMTQAVSTLGPQGEGVVLRDFNNARPQMPSLGNSPAFDNRANNAPRR